MGECEGQVAQQRGGGSQAGSELRAAEGTRLWKEGSYGRHW